MKNWQCFLIVSAIYSAGGSYLTATAISVVGMISLICEQNARAGQ